MNIQNAIDQGKSEERIRMLTHLKVKVCGLVKLEGKSILGFGWLSE